LNHCIWRHFQYTSYKQIHIIPDLNSEQLGQLTAEHFHLIGNMSDKGRTIAFRSYPNLPRSNRSKGNQCPKTSAEEKAEDECSPNLNTIGVQFFGLLLALFLIYIRKNGLSIFGCKFGVIAGILPAECVVLTLLLGEIALREFGVDVVGWGFREWERIGGGGDGR
jgi:hypothetical protein